MLENWRRKMVRVNRIYIMPSGRGMLFLAAIVVMVLTGATYNNNLIFLLAFFMFSIFVVSMLQTHYNVKGVRLGWGSSEEGFEGDSLALHLDLIQKRARHKRMLRIRTRSKTFVTLSEDFFELMPQESSKLVRVELRAWKRGVFPLPDIILETYYPLGLFRAWKVFRFEASLVVYPRAESRQMLQPRSFEAGHEDLGLRTSPEGDFGELKNYIMGESYHQIAWKHYARTGELFSKVHWGEEHKHYVIPWAVQVSDVEGSLRTISGWIKTALEENATFEMESPGTKIEPSMGLEHARRCWRLLAEVKGDAA